MALKTRKKNLGSYPYLTVVISVSLALFVLGLFGLLLIHANKLSSLIIENVELQIYLNKNVTPVQITRIEKTLSSNAYVLKKETASQITFTSKEQAAEEFIKETGEDFNSFLGENPLRDVFTIKVDPLYHSKMDSLKIHIENMSGVFEVAYMESLVESINKNITKIGAVLVGFAAILGIIVILLINNTIKLALFSQRFLIRSMQLVGATRNFIQQPFLIRSFLQGLMSGVIAVIGLLFLLDYANSKIPGLEALQDKNIILMLFGMILLFGSLFGFFSTFRAIKKYLNMSLDDLY